MTKKRFLLFIPILLVVSLCFLKRKQESAFFEVPKLSREQKIAERTQQEKDFTRDPNTGFVPTERLIHAKAYTQKKLKEKNAIPNINWTERGPTNFSGRTRSILIDANDPTGQTLFTGGMGGGLWKTSNDGQTWSPINEFFNNMTITSIAQDPQNANIIYFGTGETIGSGGRGLGIWKSTDGGQTFSALPITFDNRDFDFVNKLIVQNYQGTSTLYAATSSTVSTNGGLLFSRDGGNSWLIFKGNNGGNNDFCTDVELTSNNVVLAGFGGGGGAADRLNTEPTNEPLSESDGVYFSENGGSTWNITKQSQPFEGRIEIATSPDDPSKFYLLCENFGQGLPTLYRSTLILGQVQWVPITTPFWVDQDCNNPSLDFTRGQDGYDLALAVYPGFPNNVLVGGIDLFLYTAVFSNGLFISDNWSQLSNWIPPPNQLPCNLQYVHADQHTIVFKNQNEVYVGNDGGIFKSNNAIGNLNFAFLGNGLNLTQFYAADLDPRASSDYYIAGSQDNGTISLANNGLGAGNTVKGGDGMFCHIDQTNHNIQIVSNFNQFMHATTNSWQTSVSVGTKDKGRFVNPMDYDDVNKKVYATDHSAKYLRWENPSSGGSTLTTVNVTGFPSNLPDNRPWHIRVSPNVSGRVYFGFDDGTVRRIDNAQTSTSKNAVTIFNPNLGARHAVSCVEIEEGNENHILVTLSNYGVTSVYESTNATATNPTWAPVEGNLPDIPVRWAMFNPSNSDQAFLATELGVWSTDNLSGASTDWGPTNAGLANTRVDMIKYRKSDLQMVIATHGRGLYTSDDLGATCNGTLALNNQVISGSFQANTSISVSNSSVASSASLSSPSTTFAGFTVNDNAQLIVNKDGCL